MEPDNRSVRGRAHSNHHVALSPHITSEGPYSPADLRPYVYQPIQERSQPCMNSATMSYYEMRRSSGANSSGSARYPESSQRTPLSMSSYGAVYEPSTFSEHFNLQTPYSKPENQFDGSLAVHTQPLEHVPSQELVSFSNLAMQSESNMLHNAHTDLFGPLSQTNDMDHSYVTSEPYRNSQREMSQHAGFSFASVASRSYMHTSPRVPEQANFIPDTVSLHYQNKSCRAPHPSGDYVQDVAVPQSTVFDRKTIYAGSSSMAEIDTPSVFESSRMASSDNHLSHQKATDSINSVNVPSPNGMLPPPPTLPKKKKSKMHECKICGKKFPRPSGLNTHMNTHNNVKPYHCQFPGCPRTFAVRSNAKRHLRTHGIVPPSSTSISSSNSPAPPPYVVGFTPPTVVQPPEGVDIQQMSRAPFVLKWMPPSLSTRTNAAKLRSVSDIEESGADDEDDEDYDDFTKMGSSATPSVREGSVTDAQEEDPKNNNQEDPHLARRLALSLPLNAVVPSSSHPPSTSRCTPFPSVWDSTDSDCYVRFEERNSFREAGSHPYHPSQFHILPGPALASLRPSIVV